MDDRVRVYEISTGKLIATFTPQECKAWQEQLLRDQPDSLTKYVVVIGDAPHEVVQTIMALHRGYHIN